MSKTRLNIHEREALRMLLEYAPDALVSMLVDHAPSCAMGAAAQVILWLAEWEPEDLGTAYVEQLSKAWDRGIL